MCFRRDIRGETEIGEVTHHTGSFEDVGVKSSPAERVKSQMEVFEGGKSHSQRVIWVY